MKQTPTTAFITLYTQKNNGPLGKGYYSIPVAQQCGDGIPVFVCIFQKIPHDLCQQLNF